MLWTCVGCGCRYAPGPRCPQCGVVEIEEKNVPGRVLIAEHGPEGVSLPRRGKRSAVVKDIEEVDSDDSGTTETIGFEYNPDADQSMSP